MPFSPPSLSTDELNDRMDALLEGQALLESISDSLENPTQRAPGKGWVVVTMLEDPGIISVTTLLDHPLLESLKPDLVALQGSRWFDAADLKREKIAAAARLDAVMGVEWLKDLAERYRVPLESLQSWELAIPTVNDLPEEILGVTVVFRHAS